MGFSNLFESLELVVGSVFLCVFALAFAWAIRADWTSRPRSLEHWLVVAGAILGILGIITLSFLLWPTPSGVGEVTAYLSMIAVGLWWYGATKIWKSL